MSPLKAILATALIPAARLVRIVRMRLIPLWSFVCLNEATGGHLHSSNVILGPVTLEGTRQIQFGKNARIYPGVYLETQGKGRISLGDNVVLSSGVHIVAFDHVSIGNGAMLGEYTSVRDANHRLSATSIRDSGFEMASILIDRNVWIGRGVTVLKGVSIGSNSVIGANAVVTQSVPANSRAIGIPARSQHLPSLSTY
jgi:acetyltransferase-like isoleucine patch superfamily enzyme